MGNPPSSNGETTTAISASEAIPSTMSTTTTLSNAYIGPILSPVRMQGQQMILILVGSSAFRLYATGFTMPLNGREQPYGMPSSMTKNLHNTTTTFVGPMVNTFSPVQGSGSAVHNLGQINPPPRMRFSTQQMPNLTTHLQ